MTELSFISLKNIQLIGSAVFLFKYFPNTGVMKKKILKYKRIVPGTV